MCLLSITCTCTVCPSLPQRQGGELPISLCSHCCTLSLMEPPARRGELSLLRKLRAPSVWRVSVRGNRDDCNAWGAWQVPWEEWGATWSCQPQWQWRDGGLSGDTGEWAGGCYIEGTGLKNKTRGRTCPPRAQKDPFILT